MTLICKNNQGCRLVQTDVVVPDKAQKENYIRTYCESDDNWKQCQRYIIRKALWICPDFVLPDSNLTEDEVIERYEQSKAVEKK
ncbi:MAG TPA: hypothetical protein PLW31_00870 [Bacteroidales bacterium]|nr:hypothetical protein [Bacteroidales bacterium]HOX76560.1 hypothetical protein [Bacteroidales bacterium]HPI85224.1 hypothetical protein [Bacteroidales bacterium]HPM92656.1 hypothetical protein [Bacteroidales bacterium]